jgi:hypothetical protein
MATCEAEALASEWTADTSQTTAYYKTVADAVKDRLNKADTAQAVNDALREVVAGIWITYDQGSLRAEFELRADGPVSLDEGQHLFQHATAVGDGYRINLVGTGHQTFVYR